MKKYFDKEKKSGRWSDGFTNTKGGNPSKANKPGKNDDVILEDGSVLLIDEKAQCMSIQGDVKLFAVSGGSLVVNGKKLV